jgi:hypothetical protein
VVQPAPAAFRLTATTVTEADPRPSSSTTFSTVFSGYVPDGLHTVSPPAVDAPWTYCPPRMHPMTCEPSTSSVFGCARALLLRPLLCPLLQRGTFCRSLHVSRKTELRSSSTVRPLARLLLPLLSPLFRRGTLRRLSHVRCKTELGSSATVRPLLLLLLLCHTGKWGSRMTTRHFLQQPTRDMLLQSMEMLLSPALHRTSPR